MGSNHWLKAMSGVGIACAMLASVSLAQAQGLNGVKGHIDIPEITRTGGGKSNPNGQGFYAGIMDEFGSPDVSPTPGPIPPDRTPPEIDLAGGGFVQGDINGSRTHLFVTATPVGETTGGFQTVGAVPGPATFAPMALLALGLGRRRRA